MFDRLPIPTPFQVGDVNAYLAGRTLVDPGPDSEEAYSTLLDELEARDLAPGDLEQVLITHPHPDHFGLALKLREAGARVLASGPAADMIGDFSGRLAYEQSYFLDFLQRHGMAESTASTVTQLPEVYVHYAPNCPVDRRLAAGDRIDVAGETVTVRETAGHAPGEIIFEYETSPTGRRVGGEGVGEEGPERHAVVGDNVLAEITPNPLLQPPPRDGGPRPRVLVAFNRALERLQNRNYDRLLPGHRGPVDDPAERIDEMLAAHEDRTADVYDLLEGPTTAVEVMEGLFDDLPVTELFSGMSEAIGHLDVLEARGRVEPIERGGIVVYERVE